MSYHQFTNDQGEQYGSFEVFWTVEQHNIIGEEIAPAGWYWYACFPGCMPDGEPSGPFPNEQEAIKDATDYI